MVIRQAAIARGSSSVTLVSPKTAVALLSSQRSLVVVSG